LGFLKNILYLRPEIKICKDDACSILKSSTSKFHLFCISMNKFEWVPVQNPEHSKSRPIQNPESQNLEHSKSRLTQIPQKKIKALIIISSSPNTDPNIILLKFSGNNKKVLFDTC
jgi:hypothetical protein